MGDPSTQANSIFDQGYKFYLNKLIPNQFDIRYFGPTWTNKRPNTRFYAWH